MELLRFIQRKWNRTPSPQYFVPYKDKAAVAKDFKKTLTGRFLSMFKWNSELNEEKIKDAIIEVYMCTKTNMYIHIYAY
jgi:hypothetical protein